jgi:hypothetical protein
VQKLFTYPSSLISTYANSRLPKLSNTSLIPQSLSLLSQIVQLITLLTDGKNPRGIPSAKFIEDVALFLTEHAKQTPETVIGALNELYSKYKYMERSFEVSKGNYKAKVPELEQTIEHLEALKVCRTAV